LSIFLISFKSGRKVLKVSIVCFSSKCHDELQAVKLDEIAYLLEINELENGE